MRRSWYPICGHIYLWCFCWSKKKWCSPLYSFQQFTQTSIFILINPFNNFQDCKLMIHVSQVQQMSLMRIIKLLMRLQRRIMRQRRKKKWTTVPTRQRKSQPLRLNQRMTTTQITISPEGKTAQLLKVFFSHVYLQCNYFNLSTHSMNFRELW